MANGIPALLKPPPIINKVLLLVADAKQIVQMFQGPKWGVLRGSTPIIVPDSIISFGYKNEYQITQAPMEQGSFQSINKVATPYDVRITMTKGGDDATRSDFLNQLIAAVQSTTLYTVLTPEISYINANLINYEYQRTATNGVGLLTVELYLKEVRLVPASVSSSSTVQPGSSTAPPATVH